VSTTGYFKGGENMPTRKLSLEVISNKIFIVRDYKVMLDRDLAKLYRVKAIALRQQVSRNKKRFPGDFCFHINQKEVDVLVSQSVIPSKRNLGGYRPYVFTEQGVAMLSSVLRSQRAVLVNVAIMRAFVKLRETLLLHKELVAKLKTLEKKVEGNSEAIHAIFEAIRKLMLEEEEPKNLIGFHSKR